MSNNSPLILGLPAALECVQSCTAGQTITPVLWPAPAGSTCAQTNAATARVLMINLTCHLPTTDKTTDRLFSFYDVLLCLLYFLAKIWPIWAKHIGNQSKSLNFGKYHTATVMTYN